MLSGICGADSIAERRREEGIAQSGYCSRSKEFLEAGKKRLAGDTPPQASTGEVKDLRAGAVAVKALVADLTLENRWVRKTRAGLSGARTRYPATEKLESTIGRTASSSLIIRPDRGTAGPMQNRWV